LTEITNVFIKCFVNIENVDYMYGDYLLLFDRILTHTHTHTHTLSRKNNVSLIFDINCRVSLIIQ